MKKILVLAVVALTFATGLCRSIDDVFNAFPEADNVQLVNMPGLLDMIQSKFDAKSKEKNSAKSIIESVKILIIEDATDQQKGIARQILDGAAVTVYGEGTGRARTDGPTKGEYIGTISRAVGKYAPTGVKRGRSCHFYNLAERNGHINRVAFGIPVRR